MGLRQEMEEEESPVAMTNIYPAMINTGLFSGVVPGLQLISKPLDEKFVSATIYDAILHLDKEVYIKWTADYQILAMELLPRSWFDYLSKISFGDAMKNFQGRKEYN
eukprot:CAMPEP_0170548432 /NCGR_PEP_ID=MMETSP0211-20121228/6762_1 /TAXON_ID=311385 /ORGANISM="Pseudokeronopsis sp., Strain OXSARD2" /LENGTH=106 /DNA_ID=CAMNT_0010853999 /DNA_START=558 /DNA_END=875 /DNA_ORIENTATION=+